jgi:hypothetical protein
MCILGHGCVRGPSFSRGVVGSDLFKVTRIYDFLLDSARSELPSFANKRFFFFFFFLTIQPGIKPLPLLITINYLVTQVDSKSTTPWGFG